MDVAETLHAFQIRRALLTSKSLRFSFGVNADLSLPWIQETAASLLYIDLVSILDGAIKAVMAPADYQRGQVTKNRLEMLNRAGRLIDFTSLEAIRSRRNEIGHEIGKSATVAELADAVLKVEEQLVTWGLVSKLPAYELRWERSGMRSSDDPNVAFEQDMTVMVTQGGDVVAEAKETRVYRRFESR